MIARWLPRSFTAQLLSLLLMGLVVSHAVGLWMVSREQGDTHPLARKKSVDLYTRVFRSVEHLDTATAAVVLHGASDERGMFRIVASPLPAGSSADGDDRATEAEVVGYLRDKLAWRFTDLRVCVGKPCAEPLAVKDGEQAPSPLVLQTQRTDGQWVEATLWPDVRKRWWSPVSFSLQLSLIPIFIAVALAARIVMRPGRALVAAAGRVSRGERVEPLRVEGPLEMREILLAFNQMQSRIGHFLEDRTRMLGAISHDFRTPITSLRLRAEMVEDAALREPMVRTLGEMRTMVDETLHFARNEAFQEPTVDVHLYALLDEVMADQRAMGHDVAWVNPADAQALPTHCRVRPVALKRAFANLLDNAVRYGHHARVHLSSDGMMFVIDIDDAGPGVAPEWLEAAFAPFARIPRGNTGQRPGGSGLGLSIARSCARAHGGDVVLMPGPSGQGSRARITLPA